MDIDRLKKMVDEVDVEAASLELAAWLTANVEKYIDNHRKNFLLSFKAEGDDNLPELTKIEALFAEANVSGEGVDVMNAITDVDDSFTKEQKEKLDEINKRFNSGERVEQEDIEAAKEIIFNNDEWASKMSAEEVQVIKNNDAALDILEGCCEKVQQAFEANAEIRNELFKRLVYYYEVRGFREGVPIETIMDGYVKVSNFCYDPYEMPVKITPKMPKIDENNDFVLDEDGNVIVEVGEPQVIIEPAGFNLDLEIEYWEKKTPTSIF